VEKAVSGGVEAATGMVYPSGLLYSLKEHSKKLGDCPEIHWTQADQPTQTPDSASISQ
jgi:hypothetical protein